MTEAESPFLPDGRQWAWDSSSLGPAKECWRKYYYRIRQGYRAKVHNDDITFGGHYAKALERFHKERANGHPHDMALELIVEQTLKNTVEWHPDHNFKTRENLIRSIIWYIENYRDDPCKTVILSDGKPAVELSFRFQVSDEIILCGHLDRLVEFAGDLYVQDQKTTGSTLGQWYFKRYNPDNQMSLYTLAAQIVWHTPVKGVMIDAAQIAVGFTRFERGLTHRTDDQLKEWLADAMFVIGDQERAAEAGWPMNDSACQKYGGCEFIDVCSKSPRVRDDYLKAGFTKDPWNPLKIRE